MRTKLLAIVMLTGLACDKPVRAAVNCQPGTTGVVCSVQHQEGPISARVCWRYVAACRNRTQVTGSACETVAPMQTTSHIILNEQLTNLAACDEAVSSAVDNIAITPP